MSNAITSDKGGRLLVILAMIGKRALYAAIGLGALYFFWWLGGWLLYNDPATRSFATFGPM